MSIFTESLRLLIQMLNFFLNDLKKSHSYKLLQFIIRALQYIYYKIIIWLLRFQLFRLLRLGLQHNLKLILRYLIPVLILEFLSIFLLFKLNGIYGSLYDAIQGYDIPNIWRSIGFFTGIAMVLVGVDGYLGFYINRLAFELRTGITKYILQEVQNGKYEDQLLLGQRVQEDVSKFSTIICDLSANILRAGLKLPIFLVVIIGLTHWYTGVIILLTTMLGTWGTRKVAQRLVPLQAEQESNEAQFRLDLMAGGFEKVREQFLLINSKLKMLSFTQSGLQQIFVLLPFILLLPLYISKTLAMGPFMQSVNALGKIIDSLLVLIDNRQVIVQMESTLTRLKFLTKEDGRIIE